MPRLESDLGIFDTPSKPAEERRIFSRQGGSLQQEVLPKSGSVPDIVKKSALPVVGGLTGAALGTLLFGPGGTIGGEMVGGGLGEAANQALGITEPSAVDIGLSTAAPGAGRVVGGILKSGVRAGVGFVAPQATREAGVEVIINRFAPKSGVVRNAFKANAQAGPVPTQPIIKALDNAIEIEAGTAMPRKGAIKILQSLRNKAAGSESLNYDFMVKEVQRLRQSARRHFTSPSGDPTVGTVLNDAAKKILDSLDEISPAIKTANKLYRRSSAVDSLTTMMRRSNPSVTVRELFKDELVAGSFSPAERAEIMTVADAIGRISTGATIGAANRVIMAVAEPIATMLVTKPGRLILRGLLADPDMTAGKLAGIVGQLARQHIGNKPVEDILDQLPGAP